MLAIIIPFYKLTFFEATLQSLANQSDKRFNVYIGDDASPEDCTTLLRKFEGQFDFTYHRFESNLGGRSLTQQWERCIALSGDEEWLMILGDDDVLGGNVVEEFYKQYHYFQNISNVIRFASQCVDSINNKVSNVFLHPVLEISANSCFRRLKGNTRSSLSEYIFRRESFNKFHFRNYPLAWHSDDMAWVDFSDKKSIYSINDAIVTINVSNSSLTGMNSNQSLKKEATIKFYKDLIESKLFQFSKKQSIDILMFYEVEIKQIRGLEISEWLLLFKKYLKNFQLIPFLKLVRRILISI